MSDISTQDFKQAMRALPAQVAIVSSRSGTTRIAMTATAVTSLSAEPPQLLVCVHHLARPAAIIRDAGRFAVSLVSSEQVDIAAHCAQPGLDPEDRFARGTWTECVNGGQPLLEGAIVNFSCRLTSESRHGTHFIFVGLIEALRHGRGAPLLYHDAGYHEIGPRVESRPRLVDDRRAAP